MWTKRITGLLIISMLFLSANSRIRQTYITLDYSGSMSGDKYMISNFTAQLITLLNDRDEVCVIMNGVVKKISGTPDAYKQLRIAQPNVRQQWGDSQYRSQIGDIEAFNRNFRTDPDKNQWLFIIGDGNWNTARYPAVTESFSKITASAGGLKIFYIPYGSSEFYPSDFTTFIRQLRNVRIMNGSTSVRNVFNNSVVLIYYLTSADCQTPQTTITDQKTARVTTEIPAKKYLIFYQDNKTEQELPQIISAVSDTVKLNVSLLGKPSTSGLQYKNYQTLLSSALWEVEGKNNKSVSFLTLKFDREIEPGKLKVFMFPDQSFLLKNDSIITVSSRANTSVPGTKSQESTILLNKSEFTNALKIASGHNNLSESGNVNRPTQTGLRPKITPLKPKAIIYQAPPLTPVTFRKSASQKPGTGYLLYVKRNDLINPEKVDISFPVSYNLFFKDIFSWTDEDKLIFLLEPRNGFSQYLMPDTLDLNLIIQTKRNTLSKSATEEEITIKTATAKVNIPVDELLRRLVYGILLIIYLILLSRKARFKKGAMINYLSGNETDHRISVLLRKKGFINWLNRWFNAFVAEKSAIVFEKTGNNITFVARRKRSAIKIHKKDVDSSTMSFRQYAWKDKNYVDLAEGNELIINSTKSDCRKPTVITYDRMKDIRDDVPVFRALLYLVGVVFLLGLFFL
jgi:hypothetical protein